MNVLSLEPGTLYQKNIPITDQAPRPRLFSFPTIDHLPRSEYNQICTLSPRGN